MANGLRLPDDPPQDPRDRANTARKERNAGPYRAVAADAGRVDPNAIPTDPRQRILRIPIPRDAKTGAPCYDRELLAPRARAALKAAHEEKILANLRARHEVIALCDHDDAARKEVMALCAADIVYWINHFCWTIDPRERGKAVELPMVLYEGQEREMRYFQDVFLKQREQLWMDEKSRAWGWTWLHCVYGPLHQFLFNPNFSCLIGSAAEKDIDGAGLLADHESIFGKLRFTMKRLPSWMLPGTLLTDSKLNKKLKIKHPFNENVIDGHHFCPNWGRGPRYTMTASDEAAWSLNFGAAATSFGNVSMLNHVGSTPHGLDNDYAQMIQSGIRGEADIEVHTLWWGENPMIDADQYWGWRRIYPREKVAQERDIDYGGSSSLAILKDFDSSRQVVTARAELRAADGTIIVEAREAMDYDPSLPLILLVDPGWDDPFALVWIQPYRDGKEYRIVDFAQYEERPGPYFVPLILGYIPETTLDGEPWPYEYDAEEQAMIGRHADWKLPTEIYGDKYGDGAGTKMATGQSMYDVWEVYGCPPVYPIKVTDKTEAVQRLIDTLPRWRIAGRLLSYRTSKGQPTIVECFQNYSWVVRESPQGRRLKREPKHNQFCHPMDCLEMFLLYEDSADASAVPLAPEELRMERAKGREAFFRDHGRPPAPETGYSDDDDPITRG